MRQCPATSALQCCVSKSTCLRLCPLSLLCEAFMPPAVELFQQQPQLASRVAEAATRTRKWPPPHQPPDTDGTQAGRRFHGLSLAAASCGPAGSSGSAVAPVFQKIKVVQRCCSLAVSSLKQAQQQLPGISHKPGWGVHLMPQLRSIAAGAASRGAAACATENSADNQSGWRPGGVNTAWLALTGRGLLAAGLVLASPVGWFMQCDRAGESSRVVALRQLEKLGRGCIVSECLEYLLQQQQQGAVDAAVLHKLQQQAEAAIEHWQASEELYNEALSTGREGLQVAALCAFAKDCGEGIWLPGALQELGSAVWSAFPQKYACNDPACGNLEGLTEASCAKKACTDCKVRKVMSFEQSFPK